MTTTLDLLKSGQATIGANGIGTVTIGPERGGESWRITRMSVQCTSVLQTEVRIYRDIISTLKMLFNSKSGNSDVASGDPPLDIPSNGHIVIEWRNGTPGAIGTVVVEGKVTR